MPDLLIVDDEDALRHWAQRVVSEEGYSADGAAEAGAVRDRLAHSSYRLALLDVNMPGESGMELLSYIRRAHPEIAVLMVTGEDSMELARRAIEHGAYGYLVKPVGAGELLINIANALHRRRRELEYQRLTQILQETVHEREAKLEHALQDLELSESKVSMSQAETIFRLARLVEFRDEETGHHLQRMSLYCQALARQDALAHARCEDIRLASQLHDVGKVAIPDSVLLKPGKLTAAEFEVIKGHAETGFQMLSGSASEVVQLGASIARSHHERWDGRGYPLGLIGEGIPIEGRIAAIADVFDALTSDRVYRSALPVKTAIKMMSEESGTHFDPRLFEGFLKARLEIESIRQAYAD